jgi:nucleoside 2-deoxyribosyltransferase
MANLAEVMEKAGHATFLPQRDGLEMLAMRSMNAPAAGTLLAAPAAKLVRKAVFALDVHELLERCDAVVVNLNGRVPDEGAVVEASLAMAAAVPVVAYKQDVRAPFRGMDNPMVSGVVGWTTVSTMQSLPHAIDSALTRGRKREQVRLSDELREVLSFGRKVKALLDRFPAILRSDADAGPLLEKLSEMPTP